MKSGIYNIVNTKSTKYYVGSTIDLRQRWNEHRSQLSKGVHHNKYLQRAWDKDGYDAFVFVVVEYVAKNKLIVVEQSYLDAAFSSGKQYNLCTTAGNSLGMKHSFETKNKMSNAHKGNQCALGYKHTSETKLRIGAVSKGKQYVKGNTFRKGKHHTLETKQRLSELKRRFTSEEANNIRKRILNGEKQTLLANEYKISRGTIYRIINKQGGY
jgi:group I intron endonuclease